MKICFEKQKKARYVIIFLGIFHSFIFLEFFQHFLHDVENFLCYLHIFELISFMRNNTDLQYGPTQVKCRLLGPVREKVNKKK